jgi:hypothetical protein
VFQRTGEERTSLREDGRAMAGGRPVGGPTIAAVVAVALVLGLVGGGALVAFFRAPVSGPAIPGTEYLFLTIGFDFETGLDRYLPANFTVPTHTLVVVTITNYDNASNPVPSSTAAVRGTLGGIEVMRLASDLQGMPMSMVPANRVAHTFTMDGGPYSLNVPISAAGSLQNPMIVTFRTYFNVTGAFEWHCMAPCDTSSMTTSGFMRGTVTVVDA